MKTTLDQLANRGQTEQLFAHLSKVREAQKAYFKTNKNDSRARNLAKEVMRAAEQAAQRKARQN